MSSRIAAGARLDDYFTPVGLPGNNRLVITHDCSQTGRLTGMREHALLHVQKARRALQNSHVFIAKTKSGEAMPQLRRTQVLDRQAVLRGGSADARDDFAIGSAD